jgi:hypothetical protein
VVDDETGRRAEARRAEPGAVAVSRCHQEVGILSRLDHHPLDPAGGCLAAGCTPEPSLSRREQLGWGLAGDGADPFDRVPPRSRPAAAERAGGGLRHLVGCDVQQVISASVGSSGLAASTQPCQVPSTSQISTRIVAMAVMVVRAA